MVRPLDTTHEAHQRQVQALRSMPPRDRVRLAAEMSAEVRALAEAGIRDRHPEYSDEAVAAALAEVLLGRELALAAAMARRPLARR